MLVRSEKTCRTVQDAVDFIMDECKKKICALTVL